MVIPHISLGAGIKIAIYFSPFAILSVVANLPLETGLRAGLLFALRLIHQINSTYKKRW